MLTLVLGLVMFASGKFDRKYKKIKIKKEKWEEKQGRKIKKKKLKSIHYFYIIF